MLTIAILTYSLGCIAFIVLFSLDLNLTSEELQDMELSEFLWIFFLGLGSWLSLVIWFGSIAIVKLRGFKLMRWKPLKRKDLNQPK